MWGQDQNNKEAWNVYHPFLYENVWEAENVDPDAVNPYLRMVGQIPPKLFRDPHEPKRMAPISASSESALQLRVPSKCGVCLKSVTGPDVVLYLVSEDTIYTVSLEIADEVRQVTKSTRTIAKLSNTRSVRGSILGRSNDRFYYFLPDKKTYTQTLIETEGQIVADAASGEWLATSTDDFTTTIFSVKRTGHFVGKFRSYRGWVVCSAISATYKVHIAGTSDGILVLTSLATMEQLRVIDLEGRRPLFIDITPAWGFILVCGTSTENGRLVYYLTVYTLNGKKVTEAPLLGKGPITQYTSFSSSRGFDYFAYISKTKLFVCEVFFLAQYPVPDSFIFTNIEWLEYHSGIRSFLALSSNSKLHIVPYIPDDFECLRTHMSQKHE